MYLAAAAIAKTFCLFIATAGACLCMLPPQPIPSSEFREKYNDLPTPTDDEGHPPDGDLAATNSPTPPRYNYKAAASAFGTSYFPYIFSTWVVFMAVLDSFHALDLFPPIMPVGHTAAAQVFNTQLIIGLTITIVFSTIRLFAFRALGRFFTYQLSILPDHKLITHGLYSYVRHPSYTGMLVMFVGVLLTVTAPGSVSYDYLGAESTRWLMVVLALATTYATYVFLHRAGVEDQVLRREFGKEWEEWARVVRYKVIPGVF